MTTTVMARYDDDAHWRWIMTSHRYPGKLIKQLRQKYDVVIVEKKNETQPIRKE